jgi:Zn ribbon nucleic-acid-binding protein
VDSPAEQLNETRPWIARDQNPCPVCATHDAFIWSRGGQNCVSCARCGRHLYNAPKTETGEMPRTAATLRKNVKPSQQARIVERDLGRCIGCASQENLQIAHLLSLKDAEEFGVPMDVVESDANLVLMCEGCNLGWSGRSASVRFLVSHLLRVELGRLQDAG